MIGIQFRGLTPADRIQSSPAQQPAIRFGHATPDTVHFSGRPPVAKTELPYEIATPTSADPHSLRDMFGDDETADQFFGKQGLEKMLAAFTKKGGPLDQLLHNHRTTAHHLPNQEAYRARYAPSTELYQQLGELGYLGMTVSEDHGGFGVENALLSVVLAEKLAGADLGTGTNLLASRGLFGDPIDDLGTPEQVEKYLKPILSGEKIGAFGLTEPNIGSDPGSVTTTAKAEIVDGKRVWKLNGQKTFISCGNIADYALIIAKTIDETGKDRGLSSFIVHAGDKGFTTADVAGQDSDGKLSLQTSDTADLFLANVEVDDSRLLGGDAGIGKGRNVYDDTLTGGRIAVGAMGVGVAQRALDMEIAYAKDRKQGKFKAPGSEGKPGMIPIANYHEVRDIIAQDAIDVEVARALAYHAARVKNAGLSFKKFASMTKLFATEVTAKNVTDHNIQVHGGMGIMEETGAAKLWRDARVLRVYEGTSQVQKQIIAGEVLGPLAQKVMAAVTQQPDLFNELVANPVSTLDKIGALPVSESYPRNIFEAVEQAQNAAIRAIAPEFMAAVLKHGHPRTALNAVQKDAYRLSLIATRHETLQALKAHVEALAEAKLDTTKEEAMLRVYAFDALHDVNKLLAEMGVPLKDSPARYASVQKLLHEPQPKTEDDLAVIANALLGPSVYSS